MDRYTPPLPIYTRHKAFIMGVLCAVVAGMLAASVVLPTWSVENKEYTSRYAGLWKKCNVTKSAHRIECSKQPLTCPKEPKERGACSRRLATIVLLIIASFFAGVSAIMSLIIGITENFNMRMIRVKICIMFASFVCALAGVSTGAVWALNNLGELGVAAIIAIIPTVISPMIVVVSLSYWLERRPMLLPRLSNLSETVSVIFAVK